MPTELNKATLANDDDRARSQGLTLGKCAAAMMVNGIGGGHRRANTSLCEDCCHAAGQVGGHVTIECAASGDIARVECNIVWRGDAKP